MNIAPPHLEALKALGYTEEEARFLYLVATHSGYFVARQFLAFTGAHWGKRTTTFWNKIQSHQHVRIERFPSSGIVYHHLFSRRLYRHIGRENLRNRREHGLDFIKKRIAILDYVLANQTHQYFETEPEKVRYFCGTLNIEKHYLPSRLYLGGPGSRPTVRYFVDKFPMFLSDEASSSSPVVTFTYFHEGESSFADFVHHLEVYLPFFRQLSESRFFFVARTDVHFEKAAEIFLSLVKIPLESDVADDLVRYFRVRKAWDEKRYGAVTDADLIFRNDARSRFKGDRFEGFYRGWKQGRITGEVIRREFATNDRKRAVGFGTYLLHQSAVCDGNSSEKE